jgi:hypothetical protein
MRSVAKKALWIVFGLIVSLAIIVVASWRHETSRRALSETPNAPSTKARLVQDYGKLPLSFEANRGQTDGQVKFLSRGHGYTLFLTGDEAVLALRSASQESKFESRTEVAQHSLLNAAALPRSFRAGQLQRTTDYGQRTRSSRR